MPKTPKREASADIDRYIANQPEHTQSVLTKLRATIGDAAPDATEAFRYNMPTWEQNGHLIFFAAAKEHVGIYPRTQAVDALPEVATYAHGRGTLRFSLTEPIPYDLIAKVVEVRVKENAANPGPGAKVDAKPQVKLAKKSAKKPAKKPATKKVAKAPAKKAAKRKVAKAPVKKAAKKKVAKAPAKKAGKKVARRRKAGKR